MKVVVTSQSVIKKESCLKAFSAIVPPDDLEIITIPAVSGVNEQPFNDETVRGAKNRIDSAREQLRYKKFYTSLENALEHATQDVPDGSLYQSIEAALQRAKAEVPLADAWVSIENGIFEEDGRYIDRAVVAIMNAQGKIAISYSNGVEFPHDAVNETRKRGFDDWTVGKILQEWGRVKNHADPHADLPPYIPRADYIAEALNKTIMKLDKMGMPKILFGVCGIGSGHTFRQLPLIDHFAKAANIVIFAHDFSYDFYEKRFRDSKNVTVARVAIPFYAHNRDGIDFHATAEKANNKGKDFYSINAAAMLAAESAIGKPDLVVSDYEPICAQYSYAKGAKLVTVDQQSKYLDGDFPGLLNGNGYQNEIQMLRMFFPRAEQRLACSFFNVAKIDNAQEKVETCAPVLNDQILQINRSPSMDETVILVYMSGQQDFKQTAAEISAICANQPQVKFHIFGAKPAEYNAPNVQSYKHGDPRFHEILARCNGIVSTAGHTLLSEAMYLGIPVYAMALPLYEQQMNAKIIGENGFGISHPKFDADHLDKFIQNLPHYEDSILNDKDILLRYPGQKSIINRLVELAMA